MKKLLSLNCKVCGKEYFSRHKTTKYCSWECIRKSPIMVNRWKNSGKRLGESNEGRIAWNRGIPRTQEVKDAVSRANKGVRVNEKAWNWKGDSVGYLALHSWIKRHYGKAIKCEKCGKIKHITWANKTGQYRREREDWMTLCQSCHKLYDSKNKQVKRLKRIWQNFQSEI
jgi:hypothetical protein